MRIDDVIANVRKDVNWVEKALPNLPDEWVLYLTSDEFSDDAMAKFDKLDKDGSGSLEPDELVPIIADISAGAPFDIDGEHCAAFADIFDVDKDGQIDRAEFFRFVQFLVVMSTFDPAELKAIVNPSEGPAPAVEAPAGAPAGYVKALEGDDASLEAREIEEGDEAIEKILKSLEKGKDALFEVMSMLPQDLCEHLDSPEFQLQCYEKFDVLDADGSGSLTVDELYPIVASLAGTKEWVVTDAQCARFATIFDEDGNGDISKGEFVAFVQFTVAMLYCEKQRKQEEEEELEAEIVEGDKKIEELLAKLEKGKDGLFEVMAMLPQELCEHLDSPDFQLQCYEKFDALDEDGSGSLTVDELYPVVANLAGTREWVVTDEQCDRFAKVFDEDGNGSISKAEFVGFVQFALAMTHCNEIKAKEEAARKAASSIDEVEAPVPGPFVEGPARVPTAEAPAPASSS
jgi:Ca2+-binding EF-hand superfamily protein